MFSAYRLPCRQPGEIYPQQRHRGQRPVKKNLYFICESRNNRDVSLNIECLRKYGKGSSDSLDGSRLISFQLFPSIRSTVLGNIKLQRFFFSCSSQFPWRQKFSRAPSWGKLYIRCRESDVKEIRFVRKFNLTSVFTICSLIPSFRSLQGKRKLVRAIGELCLTTERKQLLVRFIGILIYIDNITIFCVYLISQKFES